MHKMDMGFGGHVNFMPDHNGSTSLHVFRDLSDTVHPHEPDRAAAYGDDYSVLIGHTDREHAGLASSDTP